MEEKKIEYSVEDLMEFYKDFTDGLRVMFLLHRSKEGGKDHNHDQNKKIITRNTEEFEKALREFKAIKDSSELPLRIYSTVNSRNIDKGIRKFKEWQLEMDYADPDVMEDFYLDAKNRMVSSLMQRSSRNQSNFLIDLDNCSLRGFYTIKRRLEKHTKVLLSYKTKNGFHIITEPFNYQLKQVTDFLKDADTKVNPDGLLLLDF